MEMKRCFKAQEEGEFVWENCSGAEAIECARRG